MAMKDPTAAAQSLTKALAIKPDYLPAVERLIGLRLAAGQNDGALALAHGIQKLHSDSAAGFAYEGAIQASLKKWPAAAAAYRTGLKNETDEGARSDLAVKLHAVLTETPEPAAAERFATAWRKDHPNDPVFLLYLADLALNRRAYAQAESHYQALAALRPDSVLALNNIAWLRAMQSKPGAVGYAEKALALAPSNPSVMDTLALALAADNQIAKAMDVQKQALALQPENPGLRLNLARLYVKAGDKAQARAELEQLAKLGDKFAGQAAVGQLLKSL
jgi:tetratricopeptide (TPR) repeat protein